MTKRVLKLSLICFLSLLTALFFVLTVLSFSFPKFMATQFETMGMNKLAYGCYDRAYHNSDEIDLQYIMFNKAVEIDYDWHIVYYGERIFENKNYASLCVSTSLSNQQKTQEYILRNPLLSENAQKRLYISTFNEDNYIRSKYVKALIEVNKSFSAEMFVIEEIDKALAENNFSAYTNFSAFTYCENFKCDNEVLLVKIESLYDAFIANYEFSSQKTMADFVVCQRLFEIAQTASKIEGNIGNKTQSEQWSAIAQLHYKELYV